MQGGALFRVPSWDVPADAVDLSQEVLRAVEAAWALALDESLVLPLEGGEESACFRVDDLVIRIGPAWRTDGDAEWCYSVATEAGRRCYKALAPVRTQSGRATTRVSGRPVSVWPFVDGSPGDPRNHQHVASAAQVLVELHQALGPVTLPLRPPASSATVAFIQIYVEHGGTANHIDEEAIAQLYRDRLRWELSYEEANTGPRDLLAGDDRDYRDRQNELFHTLRP